MWITLFFLVATALFLWMTCAAIFNLRWAQRLPTFSELGSPNLNGSASEDGVQCSIVIAARDEESRIEQSIQNLLMQRDVNLEVIVIDDRSTDRTGEILMRLMQQDQRVRMLRVEDLPEGWLGKCYACHLGASAAIGKWILFTDADCWMKSDLIARALLVADREKVEHITLTPGIAATSVGVQAWHLAFLITLANWFAGVNRDLPNAYLGMGAFNLVLGSAYRQCGGYESLRLTVLDDVRLGLLLRRAGNRTRGFIGGDDVECHWGTTVGSMIKIMEKNYFAAMDFRLYVALIAGFGGLLFWSVAIAGMVTLTAVGMSTGLAMFSLCIPAYILSRRLGWSAACSLLTPLIFPVLFYAMLKSAWLTTRRGGVLWRDTFYSLDSLRRGTVR